MSAVYINGTESDFRLPTLAQRVQDMSRGAGGWTQVAEAALEEFIAPLRVLGFAALERAHVDEPFTTRLSYDLPYLKVGKAGPRATIGSFVEAAAAPGKVFVTRTAAGFGPLACAVLPAGSGPQRLIVLSGRVPAVTEAFLEQCANRLLELVRPAAGGDAARAPADAISIAIRRAKREWETVVDGLPAMVGLADEAGRVLRINRSMTRVPGKEFGRSIHSLLHGGGCQASECKFARSLSAALRLLPDRRKMMVSTRDKEREGLRAVFLRHIPAREGRRARVVFSISILPEAVETANNADQQARSQRELECLLERHHLLLDGQRKQFAGTLQASLAPSLSAARQGIERALDRLRAGGDSLLLDDLQSSVSVLEGIVREAESLLARQDDPVDFEVGGLAQALRDQCAAWQSKQSGTEVQVACAVDDRNVPKSLWLTIYRFVQESLQGMTADFPAGTLAITLVPGDSAVLLAIEQVVQTEGAPGMPVESSPTILMMRELAEFSGGRFHVEASPTGGRAVEVLWSRPSTFSSLVVVPSPVH